MSPSVTTARALTQVATICLAVLLASPAAWAIPVDDAVDSVTEIVEETTDTLTDTADVVDETVDTATDTIDDAVDQTTDTLTDTVEDTTDTLTDTVEDTTDTLTDTVEDTTDTLDTTTTQPAQPAQPTQPSQSTGDEPAPRTTSSTDATEPEEAAPGDGQPAAGTSSSQSAGEERAWHGTPGGPDGMGAQLSTAEGPQDRTDGAGQRRRLSGMASTSTSGRPAWSPSPDQVAAQAARAAQERLHATVVLGDDREPFVAAVDMQREGAGLRVRLEPVAAEPLADPHAGESTRSFDAVVELGDEEPFLAHVQFVVRDDGLVLRIEPAHPLVTGVVSWLARVADQLASTGVPVQALVGLGLVLLGSGAALLGLTTRRSAPAPDDPTLHDLAHRDRPTRHEHIRSSRQTPAPAVPAATSATRTRSRPGSPRQPVA